MVKVKAEPERTRISDYPEITTLDEDHKFSIDLLDVPTESVTYQQLSKVIIDDVANAKNFRFVKVGADENNKLIFNASTVLYAEKNVTTELFDGYTFTVNEQTTTLIPANWQNYVNRLDEEPNVYLTFNNIGKKPIYNGRAYGMFGIKALDYNTLWGLRMDFVYNQQEDCWFIFKHPESFTVYPTFVNIHNRLAGVYPTTTNSTMLTIKVESYPCFHTYFNSFSATERLPDMRDVALARVGSETTFMKLKLGQIESAGASIPVGNVNFDGAISFYKYYDLNSSYVADGCFTKHEPSDPYDIWFTEGNNINNNVVKYTLKPKVTTTDTTTTITKQVIGRRMGVYYGFIS